MTFLNPYMLIGLLAAVIPVLLHFIYKKNALLHAFPAMRFLIRSQKRSFFLSRLEGFFLLLIRILIIICLSAAFAKPVLSLLRSAQRSSDTYLTTLIIDDSYSMSYTMNEGTIFEQAKNTAQKFIHSASHGDKIYLLWTSGADTNKEQPEEQSRKKIIKAINEKKISYKQHSIVDSLAHATALLEKEKVKKKQIIVLTDGQKQPWIRSEKKRLKSISEAMKKEPIHFFIVQMTPLKKIANRAIENISIKYQSMHNQRGIEIKIDVKNYSSMPANDLLLTTYLNDERVAESFLSLEAEEKAIKNIFIPIEKATNYIGRISIDSHDHLPLDDERYFSLKQAVGLKVLVVDGDPRPFPFDSESFYLMKALKPQKNRSSSFIPVMTTSHRFNPKEIEEYDIIILCNVPDISRKGVDLLKTQIEEGGKGLLFTLGDHTNPEKYNTLFDDLLPVKLRGIKKLKKNDYEYIEKQKKEHQLLEAFQSPHSGDFATARFKSYFLTQQHYRKNAEYLLTLTKGSPYLVIGKKGRGKTALLTSTIDRAWNNLPIQTIFLPLIHQIMLYLSDNLEQFKENLLIGDEKEIIIKNGLKNIRVLNPEKKLLEIKTYKKEKRERGKITETLSPGAYTVQHMKISSKKKKIKIKEEYFTVNIKTEHESDLSQIQPEELVQLLGENNFSWIPFYPQKNLQEAIYQNSITTHLWISLAFAVLILFFAESFLTSGIWRKNINE